MTAKTPRHVAQYLSAALISLFLSAVPAHAAALPGQVSIASPRLLRDGAPWVPRGVGLTGLLIVDRLLTSGTGRPQLIAAHNLFGPALLQAVRAYGADSVRVAVSQPGLNPSDPLYDPHYAAETAAKIRQIRQAGLSVIVAMQWEPGVGPSPQSGLTNDAATTAAWKTLLPQLPLADHGIMLEALNEPNYRYAGGAAPDAAMWSAWRPGMQHLVETLRATGWTGVILLDGVYGSSWIDGAPPIHDPLTQPQIGWSVHVYFTKSFRFQSPEDWDPRFGDMCQATTCIVTEFQASLKNDCTRRGNTRILAQNFLHYIAARHIGVFPWAFDHADTVMVGHSLTQMTSYPYAPDCRADPNNPANVFGNGRLVHDYFTTGEIPQ